MLIENADLPAMPLNGDAYTDFSGHVNKGHDYNPECLGMSKRETIAMHAMMGLCAHSSDYHQFEHLASDAVSFADALLSELDKSANR